jgi:type III pantothenate kinase
LHPETITHETSIIRRSQTNIRAEYESIIRPSDQYDLPMKLIIDLGNTSQKYYFFDGKTLADTFILPGAPDEETVQQVVARNPGVSAAILSSVISTDQKFINALQGHCSLVIFDHSTPLPVINRYETPATLGTDRLAAAVGGYTMFPKDVVLVIEAGTCIKYELVNRGVYLGGIISPGIAMQARAMHTFTEKLPLVHPDPMMEVPLTGVTTQGTLLSGIVNTTLASMEGIIGRYRSEYGEIKIILSGGDLNYFDKRLKYSNFARPNIVAVGLNEILDFNEKND